MDYQSHFSYHLLSLFCIVFFYLRCDLFFFFGKRSRFIDKDAVSSQSVDFGLCVNKNLTMILTVRMRCKFEDNLIYGCDTPSCISTVISIGCMSTEGTTKVFFYATSNQICLPYQHMNLFHLYSNTSFSPTYNQ